MAHATLRFYAELNDYLPAAHRQRENTLDFRPPCPVRHLVEIMGVPHTEIEILLINGVSVDLEATVHDGDRISVYPVWEAMDVGPLLRLRDFPLRETRFFADVQLGRLARYLRLLGFDTLFVRDIDDVDLVRQAVAERRIVLTRDRDLLMRRAVTHGCHIRQDDPVAQLRYVVARCDLTGSVHPFTRCMACNDLLDPVRKAAILDQLEPITRDAFHDFWRCRGCGRIYWKGSHFEKLQDLIDAVL